MDPVDPDPESDPDPQHWFLPFITSVERVVYPDSMGSLDPYRDPDSMGSLDLCPDPGGQK